MRLRAATTTMIMVLALACAGTPARAGMKLDAWRGHAAFGFAGIHSDSLAPGGSLSVGGGVDYPLRGAWRVGPELNIHLLGTSDVIRGSIAASVDYSVLEAAMLFHWLPSRGPVARVSFGPGIANPRAALVIAGGGAGFEDLTVSGTEPEAAASVTLLPRRMKVVALGGELGLRVVNTSQGAWTIVSGRVAIHY